MTKFSGNLKNHAVHILKHRYTVPTSVGVVCVGGGVGGYFWYKKRKRIKQEANKQLQFVFDQYAGVVADLYTPGKEIPKARVVVMDEEVTNYDTPVVIPADHPVFAKDTNNVEKEKKVKTETPKRERNSREPVLISKEEFFENDEGYTQKTLTYYAGDNILADDEDTPIYNHEWVVGPLRFGEESGDENVFYVRNDKRREEYEVVSTPELYSVVVLGLDIENNEREKDLKHSAVRKFRPE